MAVAASAAGQDSNIDPIPGAAHRRRQARPPGSVEFQFGCAFAASRRVRWSNGHDESGSRRLSRQDAKRAGRTGGSLRLRPSASTGGQHPVHGGSAHVAHHLPRYRPPASAGQGVPRMPGVDDFLALLGDATATKTTARRAAAALFAAFTGGKKDSYTDFMMSERCLFAADVPSCRRLTTTTSRSSSPGSRRPRQRTSIDGSSRSAARLGER